MQQMPSDVLSVILAYVDGLEDLVRVSLVSRSWAAAVLQARPSRLTVQHPRSWHEDDRSWEWLQSWHTQERLTQLQYLQLRDDNRVVDFLPDCPEEITPFSEQLISIAVLWKLQHCDLQGPFDFESAVFKLPATIRVLSLWPHDAPKNIPLSSFSKFSELKELSLVIILEGYPDDEYEDEYTKFANIMKYGEYDHMYNPDTYDVFLDSPFSTLHSLSLHGSFCSTMDPGIRLRTLFPVL